MKDEAKRDVADTATIMGEALSASMAQTISLAQSIERASIAWDQYVAVSLSGILRERAGLAIKPSMKTCIGEAVDAADALLEERRSRFGVEKTKAELMRVLSDKTIGLCNKLILGKVNGTCRLIAGHEGECEP